MPAVINIVIFIIVFAAGVVVGSFLGVIIYRLPRGLDFVRGFSFCPACGHRLFPRDLVPVVSYLALGCKCRYCGGPIPARYPAVEILGGFAALLCWAAFMPPAAFLAGTVSSGAPGAIGAAGAAGAAAVVYPASAALYFAVLACLIVIAWIDADTLEIPDSLNIAIAVCGVIAIFIGPEHGLKSHLIGMAVAAVPLFVIALLVEGAFGFGDVKLMAAAGLFLGWQNCLVALVVGIIIGGVQGAFLLATKKKGGREHFAFGPALCAGIGIAIFLGDGIIGWYFSLA